MKLLHIEGPLPYVTNTFLLVDSGEAAAIDPAAKEDKYNELLKQENAKLKYVLLTHGHHDHIASAKALCTRHGAKLIMHEADNKQFNLNADDCYEDTTPLYVGEAKIKPIFTPGHTGGSVCLLCEDILFSGDTLFEDDIGRTDLPGANEGDMRKSLKRLWNEIADDTQVLPGHGPFTVMQREKEKNYYLRDASI